MSRILIGIIVVMGIGSYFLWSQVQHLTELNKAFEVRNAEQIAKNLSEKLLCNKVIENFEITKIKKI